MTSCASRSKLSLGMLGAGLLLLGIGISQADPVSGADIDWLPGDYVDYAPSGMPDFSQCRSAWSMPGRPPQWTHAGPVALANALWWLDSAAELDPHPPDQASDTHGLVTGYPVFGRARDDHDIENLGLLVQDLAGRLETNSVEGGRGTRWSAFGSGLGRYIEMRGLGGTYRLEQQLAPIEAWLVERIALRAGVVLLLGVWEEQPEGWRRIGGHYVSLAGAEPGALMLSDPLADEAGRIGQGRAFPEEPSLHSCRENPAAHDDAAIVSHDRYGLIGSPALPGSPLILEGYFPPDRFGEAAAFQGQNALGSDRGGFWMGGRVVMAIDAAVAIVPRANRLPTTTATVSPSPRPSATASREPTAARPSPSPSPPPSASAEATPSIARQLWLPWLHHGTGRLW